MILHLGKKAQKKHLKSTIEMQALHKKDIHQNYLIPELQYMFIQEHFDKTFSVPNVKKDNVWKVFEITNGGIKSVNEFYNCSDQGEVKYYQ